MEDGRRPEWTEMEIEPFERVPAEQPQESIFSKGVKLAETALGTLMALALIVGYKPHRRTRTHV